MRIAFESFVRDGILRGRPLGRKHFAKMCDLLSESAPGEFVYLDFANIRAANGSWLNSSVAELFRWAGRDQVDIFPVLLNFPKKDFDELELVAQINKACYPCTPSESDPLKQVSLVGHLEPTLRRTLGAVIQNRRVTGASLSAANAEEGIGATGWNNRLRDLNLLRLIARHKAGRRQIYSPIALETSFYGRQRT
jgi:hypothetical protein